ncbi:MAG TPA: tetratricopeptide repeat protein [Verrucomicrobiae bacterium]|nr:tetratricopeptide repeat protein [Verrucomicrobiae bacterium]
MIGLTLLARRPLLFRFFVCITMVSLFSTGCSKESRRDRALEKANEYFQAGDFPKASIEYQNAAKLDPEHNTAIQRLGQIYFKQGQSRRAHAFLRKAYEKDRKNLDILLPLLRIYRDGNDATNATAIATEILALQPANEEAVLTLVAMTSTEQESELNALLERLRSSENKAAFELASGIISVRRREFEKAETAFKAAEALNPSSPHIHAAMGNYYLMRGNRELAREHYEKRLKAAPDDLFSQIHFAEFRVLMGEKAQARRDLEALTKKAPEFVPAWSVLSAMALEDSRLEDCAQLVGKTLSLEPTDFRALLVRARLSLAQTNISQAIAQIRQLKAAYPRVPQVNMELARALLATNDMGAAVTALNEALAANPNFADALFLKAQVTYRQGDFVSAQSAFSDLTKLNPRLVPPQLGLAEVHLARGQPEQAIEVYNNLASLYPSNAQPRFLTGTVYRRQGKTAEAEKALNEALRLDRNHLPALHELLDLKVQEKQFAEAEEILKRLETLKPGDALVLFSRARLRLAQENSSAAENDLKQAIAADPSFFPSRDMLTALYLTTGRNAEALAFLEQSAAAFPRNFKVLLQTALLLDQGTNHAQAAAAYEKAIAVEPDSTLALNNLAYLYAEDLGNLERALELARRARQLAPEDPVVADTYGWVQFRRRDYAQALTPLLESAAKLTNNPHAQFHAGMASYMQGDEKNSPVFLKQALAMDQNVAGAEQARRCLAILQEPASSTNEASIVRLQEQLRIQPDDPIAGRRMAEVHRRAGNWAAARSALEKVLETTPKSAPVLIELAELLADRFADPKKAFELAKQARTADAANPAIAQTFARLAMRSGEQEWAASVLQEQVQNQRPPSAELLYDCAVALHSIGRTPEAIDHVRRSLEAAPSAAVQKSAQQFLVFATATNAPNAELVADAQARLKTEPQFLPALMVVASGQTTSGDIAAARKTYEQIMQDYPKFSPALRALVLLPGFKTDDPTGHDLALRARKAYPRDPQVAFVAGKSFFQRNDFNSARLPLTDATSGTNENAEALYYLGMIRYKSGDRARGVEDVRKAANLGLPAPLASAATDLLIQEDLAKQR